MSTLDDVLAQRDYLARRYAALKTRTPGDPDYGRPMRDVVAGVLAWSRESTDGTEDETCESCGGPSDWDGDSEPTLCSSCRSGDAEDRYEADREMTA